MNDEPSDGGGLYGDNIDFGLLQKLGTTAFGEAGPLTGGGGGGMDGLEPRVAKLEAHLEHIRDDIGGLKSSAEQTQSTLLEQTRELATINERTQHLATKNYVFNAALLIVSLMIALITLSTLFQDTLQSWVGLGAS